MEVQLEKFLKEKEQATQLAIVQLTIVAISVTTTPAASTSTSAPAQTSYYASELVKAMDYLSIQELETVKLKAHLKTLLEHKLKIYHFYVAELQKTHQFNQKIEEL